MFTGEVHTIGAEYFIEGTVTSVDNITPGKFFVEDAYGAIRVSITSGVTFSRGDVVLFNLKQGVVDLKQGVLEVAQVMNATLVAAGEISPASTSLEELLDDGGNFQSRYVQVSDLHFAEADGTVPMYGDHVASDGERTIVVRTTGFASFRNEALPEGNLRISGILTNENGILILHPQMFHEDVVSENSSLRPWNPELPIRQPSRGTKK
jgi:hypothetical protein